MELKKLSKAYFSVYSDCECGNHKLRGGASRGAAESSRGAEATKEARRCPRARGLDDVPAAARGGRWALGMLLGQRLFFYCF